MKKKLIAIAVAGLLAAPLANAQTANVTIYGRINMDIDFISSATNSGLGELQRVSSNTSRIGFKGTEALGGGLNAIFQIESQFQGDGVTPGNNNWNQLASRETWLGLQGGWGAVKLGYMTTPYDDAHAIFGNTNTALTSILQTGALWGQHGANNRANGSFGARTANSIRYESPNISGFTGKLQYSTNEATSPRGWVGNIGLFYDNAGLQAAAVYETNQEWRGADLNDQAFTIMAGYNFGVVRPALVYEHIEYDTAGGTLKRDLFGGTATVPLGSGKLYGAVIYANKGKGDGLKVGNVNGGKDTGAVQYELSYSYDLSKRTTAYVGYVYIDNDKYATYTFGHNGNGSAAPGVDQQGLILGMVHFF
ncbi:MAG: porin [Burkholderiales bacterium]|jgi:predicted porin|nr:porin [Burkholderiales bacterium]